MLNPISYSLQFQKALVEATVAASRIMTVNYMRFVDQQNRMLRHSFAHQRGNDRDVPDPPKATRRRRTPCRGPDLHDHYGHRAHDVDPEHI